jgi:branched-subunit amino acid transport protein
MTGEPYLWLLMAMAIAATYFWRGLGALLSARINPQGAVFQWVSCVSYAMLAGLIARMTVFPLGGLAETLLFDRLAAMGVGFAVFYLARQKILLGVAAAAGIFIALTALREVI